MATADDTPLLHEMLKRLAESMGAARKMYSRVEDIATALSGDHPAIHALIAEKDGAPVGMAIFFLTYSTWRGSPGVYLQDIYVARGARGAGIGRRLMQQVADWAIAHGADHLRLSVDPDNTTARSFYDDLGLSYRDDEVICTLAGEAFRNMGSAQ